MDAAEREAQFRTSMDVMDSRLKRTGEIKLADVDENTVTDAHIEGTDLFEIRKEMMEFAQYQDKDKESSIMSEPLQALMRHMHSYASRYNVDLYRSLKEGGGRQTADGGGALSREKFTSTLLSAFNRMGSMFKPHLLEEICNIYGTGPQEGGMSEDKKFRANAYAGRQDHPDREPSPKAARGYLEVKWIAFANDVGEKYLTFPPKGHGNELSQDLTFALPEGHLYVE